MADELDPRLEAHLRTVLRAEADALPFTLRADQVAGRLAERRRASNRRRYAVVAAAAVVAVGAAALGVSLGRITGPAAVTPPPAASVAPPSVPMPSPLASLAADCVPADDAAILPALDLVDGTGALIDPGEVVYDRRSDGATTGDPDGWVVPATAIPASLDGGLDLDAGDGCVATWSLLVAQTADVASAIGAGVAPVAQEYVVSGGPEGGHAVTFNELPTGDVLIRVAAAWYSTAAEAPVTVRVYRLLNGEAVAEPSPSALIDGVPSLPAPLPGERTLFELPIRPGDAPDELSAGIPAGTDAYYVTLDCIGSGTVTLDIDGVVWSFPCEGTFVTDAAPGADDTVEVTASAEGSLRALVRLGAFDMKRSPNATFVPPALTLTGPDATAGDQVSVRGYVGCGLSYEPRRGSGAFGDECGPSWMPIAAALRQQPGSSVSFALGGGWNIVDVTADVAAHEDILPTRNPVSTQLTPQRDGSGWSLDVPSPGDWGIRLSIRGEKDGDSFSVPYYTRVVVPSEP